MSSRPAESGAGSEYTTIIGRWNCDKVASRYDMSCRSGREGSIVECRGNNHKVTSWQLVRGTHFLMFKMSRNSGHFPYHAIDLILSFLDNPFPFARINRRWYDAFTHYCPLSWSRYDVSDVDFFIRASQQNHWSVERLMNGRCRTLSYVALRAAIIGSAIQSCDLLLTVYRPERPSDLLHIAIEWFPSVVSKLLECGESVRTVINKQSTLDQAVQYKRYDVMQFLLDAGVQHTHNTIRIAVDRHTPEALEILHRANVSIIDLERPLSGGATCLHLAICSGNLDCVKYLIKQRVCLNKRDHKGQRPLDLTVDRNIDDIAIVLLEAGAWYDKEYYNKFSYKVMGIIDKIESKRRLAAKSRR